MNKKDLYEARLKALSQRIQNQKSKALILLEKSAQLKNGMSDLVELIEKDLKQGKDSL